MGLAVGEVEVAKDGDLLEGVALSRLVGDRRDARRIGVWPGDLGPDAGLCECRAMDRPGHNRHVVAALEQPARKRGEGPDVARRADGGEGDPHAQMVAMRRGAMRGP